MNTSQVQDGPVYQYHASRECQVTSDETTGGICLPQQHDVLSQSSLQLNDGIDYSVYSGGVRGLGVLGQIKVRRQSEVGQILGPEFTDYRMATLLYDSDVITIDSMVYCRAGCEKCLRVVPYVAFVLEDNVVRRVCSEYCRRRTVDFSGSLPVRGKWHDRNKARKERKKALPSVVSFSSDSSGGVLIASEVNPDSSVSRSGSSSYALIHSLKAQVAAMSEKLNFLTRRSS